MKETFFVEICSLVRKGTFQVDMGAEIAPNANVPKARFIPVIKQKITGKDSFRERHKKRRT